MLGAKNGPPLALPDPPEPKNGWYGPMDRAMIFGLKSSAMPIVIKITSTHAPIMIAIRSREYTIESSLRDKGTSVS